MFILGAGAPSSTIDRSRIYIYQISISAHDVIAITPPPQKNDLCTEELRDRANEVSLPLTKATFGCLFLLEKGDSGTDWHKGGQFHHGRLF